MQYLANDVSVQPHDRNDAYHSIVSGLVSPIAQVQASLQMIESAIARETSLGNEATSADIIVLDNITPRYAKAGVALFLLDSKAAGRLAPRASKLRMGDHAQWPNANLLLDAVHPARRSQAIRPPSFDAAPGSFFACLPFGNRTTISVPLTRTSSHRR